MRIITIGVAIDALHLTWLSAGVAVILGYLPNVLAAAAIVAVGYLVGNFAFRKLADSPTVSPIWARVARIAILAVAGFMAVHQLGIATAIVATAFTLCLGALAVAAAVAFGLGNRELAGRITQDWYERGTSNFRGSGAGSFSATSRSTRATDSLAPKHACAERAPSWQTGWGSSASPRSRLGENPYARALPSRSRE